MCLGSFLFNEEGKQKLAVLTNPPLAGADGVSSSSLFQYPLLVVLIPHSDSSVFFLFYLIVNSHLWLDYSEWIPHSLEGNKINEKRSVIQGSSTWEGWELAAEFQKGGRWKLLHLSCWCCEAACFCWHTRFCQLLLGLMGDSLENTMGTQEELPNVR